MAHETYLREEAEEGPSDRSFGGLITGILALIAAFRFYKDEGFLWWLVAAGVLAVMTVGTPHLLSPLKRLWMKFGEILSKIVNPVVMGILFFVVLTPFAIVVRAVGKKLLATTFDPGLNSYWIERTPPAPAPDSMNHQF
ncbi:MAG: hypothetical protein JOY67_10440 [Hyphomicrobiales bacterium]|nr:hypothetical protein [Hyphomicrobiales bacterium]MBV9113226.1 hypothetical protein [Hyphomicrobiales bacterium]MBV9516599.1 hypothetical protein [Hyphomicrobiales bacterium]